jgi:hypothetical protein
MFVFFSNRLGCLGSVLVSLALSAVLVVAMRGCSGASTGGFGTGPSAVDPAPRQELPSPRQEPRPAPSQEGQQEGQQRPKPEGSY